MTEELRRTTVEDGILGDIRFDEYGDLVEGPVTIFRVVGKGHSGRLPGWEGAVVDRVITARADRVPLVPEQVSATLAALEAFAAAGGG